MKYYYNDKLIRTSDHVYTHAVIDTKTGKAVACRNGIEQAEAARYAELSFSRGSIRYYEDMIRAMKAGREYFFHKVGRMTEKHKISENMTVESAEKRIADIKAWIEQRMSELIIVPIEAR